MNHLPRQVPPRMHTGFSDRDVECLVCGGQIPAREVHITVNLPSRCHPAICEQCVDLMAAWLHAEQNERSSG